MRRHLHLADWVLREVRYWAAKQRRNLYVYRPTEAARRTLRDIARDTFRRHA